MSATQADTAMQGAETARTEAVIAQNAAKVSADQASASAQQTTADKTATAGYAKTAKTNSDSTAADRQAVQEMAEQVTADKATVAENAAQVAEDRTAAETAAQTAQAVADSLPDDYVTAIGKIAENTAEINNTNTEISELKKDLAHLENNLELIVGNNKLKTLYNGYMDTDGNVVVSSNQNKYSNKIKVKEGQKAYVYANVDSVYKAGSFRFVCAFDADGNVVPSSGASSIPIYTVPNGVAEIVVTIAPTYQTETMVTIDYAPSEYEAYKEYWAATEDFLPTVPKNLPKIISDIQKDVADANRLRDGFELKKSKNLFDGTYVDNKYIPASGIEVNSENYFHTNYIPVSGLTSIYVQTLKSNGEIVNVARRFLTAYDKDKNLIAEYCESTSSTQPYTVHDEVEYIIISINKVTSNPNIPYMMIIENAAYKYIPYFEPYYVAKEKTIVDSTFIPHVILPNEIYVAEGRTIEIYNNQVCINADRFRFKWICDVGYQYEKKFQIVGTSGLVGSQKTLKLELYNDELTLLYEGSTTIKFVGAISSSKKILPIGDSLTNGKWWLGEVENLNSNIQYVGTFSKSVKDADDNTRTVYHEGRSGFKASDYVNGSPYTLYGATETTHNAFYDLTNERFSPLYYSTQTGITFDAIQLFVGTNGQTLSNEANANDIKTLVDNIRLDYPTMPIFIVNAPYVANQNGIGAEQKSGASDGYAGSLKGQMKYQNDMQIFNLATKLKELLKDYTNLYFVPVAFCHDSEHNYGAIEVPVNPRSTQTEIIPYCAIHPYESTGGYWQFADIMYSTYCGAFN